MGEGGPAKIALIVAMAQNGVIGRDGDLPWRLSSDLKLFRRNTMGKPLIMGRKTFASIAQPLSGRDTIVVTRDAGLAAEGAVVAHSLENAISRARDFARERGVDEIMVIGGAEIFRKTLPLASRMYLTRVDASVAGDVIFPATDWTAWRETFSQSYNKGASDEFSFTFSILERP